MLSGIVPELRAQTADTVEMGSTLEPLPAPPLSPASAAILFAQARKNANVKNLLIDAGPNLEASTPEYSYDLGNRGKLITIPLRDSTTTETSAYIFYGLIPALDTNGKTVSANIIFSIRPNGSMRFIDFSGKIVPPPPELENLDTAFHQAFLPNQYSAMRRQQQPPQPYGRKDYCDDQLLLCMVTARTAFITSAGWLATCIACVLPAIIVPLAPLALPAAVKFIFTCLFPCGSGMWAWWRVFLRQRKHCANEFEICMGRKEPPPVPFTSPPKVPQGMPTPPMASPPGVPSGMPTPPFSPYSPGGKF